MEMRSVLKYLVATTVGMWMCFASGAAISEVITGRLPVTPRGPTYEGFHYVAYDMQSNGAPLTVRWRFNGDGYLLMKSPTGIYYQNDDDPTSPGESSRLSIPEPAVGVWTIIATTFDAEEFGPFILEVDGAVALSPQRQPSLALVQEAFLKRGIKESL